MEQILKQNMNAVEKCVPFGWIYGMALLRML